MTHETLTVVTVTLEDRPDGGLRVYSENLPGLILSGPDKQAVAEAISTAICGLFAYKGQDAVVHSTTPIAELLKLPRPRDVDMHVKHAQFVVELRRAA
jgi:hypothetical protein